MDNQCLICFVGETILLSSKMIATSIFYYCILIVKMKKKDQKETAGASFLDEFVEYRIQLWKPSRRRKQPRDRRKPRESPFDLGIRWTYMFDVCLSSFPFSPPNIHHGSTLTIRQNPCDLSVKNPPRAHWDVNLRNPTNPPQKYIRVRWDGNDKNMTHFYHHLPMSDWQRNEQYQRGSDG